MPSAVFSNGAFVIPAQHTDRLRRILRGELPRPAEMERIIQQVFSSDYTEVYDIPASKIVKLSNCPKATRLVLCADFDGKHPASCALGDECTFVHADISEVSKSRAHINYAWMSVEVVTYERFEAGRTLRIAAPGSKVITDVIESQLVLKTKALESQRRPLSHCAHYYYNRTCTLGPNCQFVHAVYVDANAKPHQRAPAPTQLGRPARNRKPEPVAAKPACERGERVARLTLIDPSPLSSPTKASPAQSDSDLYAPQEAFIDPLACAMLGRVCSTPGAHSSRTITPATTPMVMGVPSPNVRGVMHGDDLMGSMCAMASSVTSVDGLNGSVKSRGTPTYRHNPYGSFAALPPQMSPAGCTNDA